MKISKETMIALRTVINGGIAELNQKLAKDGVKLTLGNGSYDPNGNIGTFKLEVAGVGEDGEIATKEGANLDAMAKMYGVESPRGKEVTCGAKKFILTGYNSKGRKFPFLGRGEDGKIYKLPSAVEKQIGFEYDFEKRVETILAPVAPAETNDHGESKHSYSRDTQ